MVWFVQRFILVMLLAMLFYLRVPVCYWFSIISLPSRLNSTSSETLDVPWLVKYLGIPFSDAGSYFQNQCVAFSSSLSKSIASKGTQTNPLPPSWATLHDIDLGDLKNFQKKSASEATRDQNAPQGDGVHIVYDNFVKVSGNIASFTYAFKMTHKQARKKKYARMRCLET